MAENGTALVVDDERIAARNLEHLMKKEGYDVRSAQSGAAAFALLEQQPFDVVLTDLRMEKIDGMAGPRPLQGAAPGRGGDPLTGYATTDRRCRR